MQREHFKSRLGFILISAGCAIGLGNVWRFPYIVGNYGGAAFVLLYLVFLVLLGLPIMCMEFAIGRGSNRSIARAFDELEKPGTRWHYLKWPAIAGNYLLMMFYTTVAGWMLAYVPRMASGEFVGSSPEAVGAAFDSMLLDPAPLVLWMAIVCVIGIAVCSLGLQKGVERITKAMMSCLLVIMVALCVRSLTLDGAEVGLAFYLAPDFNKLFADFPTFASAVYAAMGQAFFTLSVGMGGMAIFGSYIDKKRSLAGEAASIALLDTGVAFMAGLIIFPACFAFGINPGSGPGLVFVTLPVVFDQMWMGSLWGTLFFLFMSFAALSTVIAVFENIICFAMDEWGWSRKTASLVNLIAIPVLSLPCALGFNLLSGATIPGIGDIQAIEDFLVSSNIMPLGSLALVIFCLSKKGWGWKNFLAEANTGKGLRFPDALYLWMKFGVPVLIIVILIMGWAPIVGSWFA